MSISKKRRCMLLYTLHYCCCCCPRLIRRLRTKVLVLARATAKILHTKVTLSLSLHPSPGLREERDRRGGSRCGISRSASARMKVLTDVLRWLFVSPVLLSSSGILPDMLTSISRALSPLPCDSQRVRSLS